LQTVPFDRSARQRRELREFPRIQTGFALIRHIRVSLVAPLQQLDLAFAAVLGTHDQTASLAAALDDEIARCAIPTE
jgi:hypothetical protein